jgi:hypothetical protein
MVRMWNREFGGSTVLEYAGIVTTVVVVLTVMIIFKVGPEPSADVTAEHEAWSARHRPAEDARVDSITTSEHLSSYLVIARVADDRDLGVAVCTALRRWAAERETAKKGDPRHKVTLRNPEGEAVATATWDNQCEPVAPPLW